MKKLTATFRVVTKMFLGGSEPLDEAELRLSSFKGALRFWWRALHWRNGNDVAGLRLHEAALFGSSESGQSRVLMRLEKCVLSNQKVTENWSQSSWQRYTGYGLRDKGERCFLPPCDWKVTLNWTRCEAEEIEPLFRALKMFGLVGGLGSRSRKGWGSTTLVALDGSPWICPKDPASWRATVQALLGDTLPDIAPLTAATRDSRWNAGPLQTSATAAQRWLAERYRDHVKATIPKAERAQFGLPRAFKNGTPPRMERRASPLLLHIHSCGDTQTLPCAMWLPSAFLENAAAIPGNGDAGRSFVESLDSIPPANSR